MGTIAGPIAYAQQPQAPATQSVTAAEQTAGARYYSAAGLTTDDGSARVPETKRQAAIEQRALDWVKSISPELVKGIQLDAMGNLALLAGQDAFAQQQLETRLATPTLSLYDRAYTLLLGVRIFARANDTTRMRIANGFLTRLDALPREMTLQKYLGHIALAGAYYGNGDVTLGIAQFKHAFALIPSISFERRDFGPADDNLNLLYRFGMVADMLSGLPNGRAQIDSLGKWLIEAGKASPEILAHDTPDSAYARRSLQNVSMMETVFQQARRLGQPAPNITANYWFNMPVPTEPNREFPGTHIKRVDDGIIRVMMYGHYECLGCLLALPKLERLQKTLPKNVEIVFVSDGSDTWGATPCTPDEMAQHLKHYYIEHKKYTFPIALFIGNRVTDVDGGTMGGAGSPSFAAYPITGFPTFVVTDGRGRVRRFGIGEDQLKSTINFLVAEAAQSTAAPPKPIASASGVSF